MKTVSFTPEAPRFNSEKVIEQINRLSEAFRAKGLPVVFIQFDERRENYCSPGSVECKILGELVRRPEDEVIFKRSDLLHLNEKFKCVCRPVAALSCCRNKFRVLFVIL